MRGLRSFIVLLVVAVALGAYRLLVDSKRPAGDDDEKQDKVFTVEADKIDEITIKSESGEQTTLQKTGHRLADRRAGGGAGRRRRRSRASPRTSSTLEVQRVIDENPADLKEFGLAEPRVEVAFKAGGQEQHAAARPEDADRRRPLRQARRRQPKVFLISVVPRLDLQQDDVRPARQGGPEDRSRQGRLARDRRPADRTLRFAKQGGEWQIAAAGRGARRLRRHRGAASAGSTRRR